MKANSTSDPTREGLGVSRRHFVGSLSRSASLAAAVGSLGVPTLLRGQESAPLKTIRVGVMGLSRGDAHVAGYLAQPGVEVAYLCDVDRRAFEGPLKRVAEKQAAAPKTVTDFRRILDDPTVDALSIAAPNHWHAPATILGVQAGKHVYVEKPGSHNAQEAFWMVAAARKHQRLVQMGNQRRSWPHVQEAIAELHSGAIGNVRFARTWYAGGRGSIGVGQPAPTPEWLDYALWQGPAPALPYRSNVVHYNWHWRWHWGGGELANNGIHALDLARWGLNKEYPLRVTCAGGRYHFEDDQETPDTIQASYDFGDCLAIWEGHSCTARGLHGTGFGVEFEGDRGSLLLLDSGWKLFDPKNKILREGRSQGDNHRHFANFIAAIRDGTPLNAEIESGQISTLMCHLGNLAWQSRQTVSFDPVIRQLTPDSPGHNGWGRDYQPEWQPTV